MDELPLIIVIVVLVAVSIFLIVSDGNAEQDYYKQNVCKYLGGVWHESVDGPLGTGLCVRDGEIVKIQKRGLN